MNIENIRFSDLSERMKRKDFNVLSFNLDLNMENIRNLSKNLLKIYKLKSYNNLKKYRGIGLQYSDDDNPYYDAVDPIIYIQNNQKIVNRNIRAIDMVKINSLGNNFLELFNQFSTNFIIYRSRFLETDPSHVLPDHSDGPDTFRIHFPIITDPRCIVLFGNEEYHLNISDCLYIMNTEKNHSIQNNSNISRVHLVLCIKHV